MTNGIAPDDLDAATTPDVMVLLRFRTEAELERMQSQMAQRGFRMVSRFPCEGDGTAQLRFFGAPSEVLHTTAEPVGWAASQALWQRGIPFGWTMSQGDYLFVPGAHAETARAILMQNSGTKDRVILADGTLVQDMMRTR